MDAAIAAIGTRGDKLQFVDGRSPNFMRLQIGTDEGVGLRTQARCVLPPVPCRANG